MYTIGLTGGSGTGKGYVSRIFNGYNIPSLDTDIVSRKVCEIGSPCLDDIVKNFGYGVLNDDKSLDRKTLGKIVFNDRKKLELLNAVTHKYILRECNGWLRKCGEDNYFAAIIDAPVLFESGFNYLCDYVISVVAETDTRIERIMARDGITRESAVERIGNQHKNDFFINHSDFIIYNNKYDRPDLQIDLIIQQIRWV